MWWESVKKLFSDIWDTMYKNGYVGNKPQQPSMIFDLCIIAAMVGGILAITGENKWSKRLMSGGLIIGIILRVMLNVF